jgi:uncharacterized membrane protein
MNFKLKALSLIIVLTVLVSVSCKKDNKQTVTPTCDITNVTYSTVSPIFKNNCTACHNSTGGLPDLSTESAILSSYSAARIINSINHVSGYSKMPQGGSKLSDCDINKITIWLNSQAK